MPAATKTYGEGGIGGKRVAGRTRTGKTILSHAAAQ